MDFTRKVTLAFSAFAARISTRKISRFYFVLAAAIICVSLFVYTNGFHSSNDVSFINGILSYKSAQQQPYNNIYKHLVDSKDITVEESYVDGSSPDLNILDFDRKHIKYIYPEVIDSIYESTDLDNVDWSKFAYVLYATSSSHMCNSMMIFAELRKFKTRAQLVLLVRKEFLEDREKFSEEHDTLTSFAKKYNVQLKATEVIQITGDGDENLIWVSSFTKLMVFNETEYDRIIYMDADSLLLKGNLDELFFLPPAKVACPAAYWLIKKEIEELQKQEQTKYDPKEYKFEPLTIEERQKKLQGFIDTNIKTYLNPKTEKLPTRNSHHLKDPKYRANERNFYHNLYNNLPNYITNDEFLLTNIIMVIEPTRELFKRVEDSIAAKQYHEFDMDIVQNHLVPLKGMLDLQAKDSLHSAPDLKRALNSTPEFLILPPQPYATLTSELNTEVSHFSYLADSFEQVFAHLHLPTKNGEPAYYETEHMESPAKHFYPMIKYLHFSDAPIPKPWFKQRPEASYMDRRRRCESHPDFHRDNVVKPKDKTKDCAAGTYWEKAHEAFGKIRWDICHLELIDTSEDTYHSIIN